MKLGNTILLLALAIALLIAMDTTRGSARDEDPLNQCQKTARHQKESCITGAFSGFWLAIAICDNLPTREERIQCRQRAVDYFVDDAIECEDQYDARMEICEVLEGPYNPVIRPEDFVAGVDHPYHPLVPGTTRIYEGMTSEGTERIEVTATHETKVILGVTCIVVRGLEYLNGELVQDTFDWFAQDVDGNVWYFGEVTAEFEHGELSGIEGSWRAGVEGAKPGIVMQAVPEVGDLYRQELFLGEAEDMGEILGLGETVVVPYGTFDNCILTKDFSPVDPDAIENKAYAPGIGVILEMDLETGDMWELVDIIVE